MEKINLNIDNIYMNPCIYKVNDYHIIIFRVQFNPKSKLYACRWKDGKVISDFELICENGEDPRTFTYNDERYISYSKLYTINNKLHFTKISIMNLKSKKEIYLDLNYLNNWEKNWIFFQNRDELHMIYNITPLEIYKVNLKRKTQKLIFTMDMKLKIKLRGGTNVIKIGDYNYTFLHSLDYNIYGMKFLDDYSDIKISKKVVNKKEKIYFPTGLLFENNNFEIFMGVDDKYISKLKISFEDVEKLF
jgi:predicted GH43/DUF377 family glycosyl hydrolase